MQLEVRVITDDGFLLLQESIGVPQELIDECKFRIPRDLRRLRIDALKRVMDSALLQSVLRRADEHSQQN